MNWIRAYEYETAPQTVYIPFSYLRAKLRAHMKYKWELMQGNNY